MLPLQLDVRDAAGASPLHLAADAPIAAVLLAADAPVNAVNNAGQKQCCRRCWRHLACCTSVLGLVHLASGQCTAMPVSSVQSWRRVTSPLWRRGCAAVPAAETPLFGAAASGATGLIRVLARSGAHLDQQDDCGETALIRACSR
jgi:ankyrin repeat protein